VTRPLWYTLVALAGLVVVAVLWRVARGDAGRRYRGTLVLFALGAALGCALAWAPAGWRTLVEALALIALCFGIVRASIVSVEVLARRRRTHYSTIFFDLLTLVLYGLVVLAVAGGVLGIQVTPLLATSALVTAVIGLALQATLSNVFSGLSLQMQKPFEPGDWVHVQGHLGRVRGIGWRSTQLVTRSLDVLDVPNAQLANEVIVNHRGRAVGDELFVGLEYGTPPNRAKTVMLAVLKETSGIATTPEPRVELSEFGDSAIRYRLRFWMDGYAHQEQIRDSVMTRLWYALRRHHIRIPYPILTLERARDDVRAEAARLQAARVGALRHVDFLDGVGDDDLNVLAHWVHPVTFARGEVICREGDTGDTFYILMHGKAEVVASAAAADGEFHVADLEAPSFFGEMSLLTDEPRSATVRAATDAELLVVEREGFQRLFHSRPGLAEAVSRAVVEHRTELESRREQQAAPPESVERRSRRIFARMQAILRF
jgi:small-conductance mechanosensitive channel/CRP-like cAMP-binding protein